MKEIWPWVICVILGLALGVGGFYLVQQRSLSIAVGQTRALAEFKDIQTPAQFPSRFARMVAKAREIEEALKLFGFPMDSSHEQNKALLVLAIAYLDEILAEKQKAEAEP